MDYRRFQSCPVTALVIPDAYASALLPLVFLGLVSLIAFLFRQNARSNEALATVAQQLKDIDRRTTRVEDAVFSFSWNQHQREPKDP